MYHRRFNKPIHVANPDEPEPEPTSEAGPASPSSCDDTKAEAPSPKKRFCFSLSFFHGNWEVKCWKVYVHGTIRRREMKKRVVTVPIGDVDGSKSKGETYPPSDSWAWRKYGQKPIKGSPYPRYALIYIYHLCGRAYINSFTLIVLLNHHFLAK